MRHDYKGCYMGNFSEKREHREDIYRENLHYFADVTRFAKRISFADKNDYPANFSLTLALTIVMSALPWILFFNKPMTLPMSFAEVAPDS